MTWKLTKSFGLSEIGTRRVSNGHQTTYEQENGDSLYVKESPRQAEIELHSTVNGRNQLSTVHTGTPATAKQFLKDEYGIEHPPAKDKATNFEEERKINPNYPFSKAIVFCEKHDPDSDVSEVIPCDKCSKRTDVKLNDKARALFRSEADMIEVLNDTAEKVETEEPPKRSRHDCRCECHEHGEEDFCFGCLIHHLLSDEPEYEMERRTR